jgi:hypothetical protein
MIPDAMAGCDATARLLAQAARRSGRSVERLIQRLELDDGPTWLRDALKHGRWGESTDVHERLSSGTASLDELRAVKDASKALYERVEADAHLAGVAGYFFSLAAAIVQYGTCIGSYDRAELRETFLDLASVSPPPWSDLCERAASFGGS